MSLATALLWQVSLGALIVGCEYNIAPQADGQVPDVFWDSTKTALVAEYNAAFGELHGGLGCSGFPNDDGTLSAAENYLLSSLLTLYEATRRPLYLDEFVQQAQAVLAYNDQYRDLPDYRGRLRPGWSATRYSVNGERVQWLVDDGAVLNPLLQFGLLVRTDSSLWRYRQAAQSYVAVAQSVMAKFDPLYVVAPDGRSGQYLLEAGAPAVIADPDKPVPLPLNWDAAAGTVQLALWQLTDDVVHRSRAIQLGERFRRELSRSGSGYVWHYWAEDGRARFHSDPEDISHGAIDFGFAVALAREGLVFSQADLTAFAQTLVSQVVADGFLPFIGWDLVDRSVPDPKCGHVWLRRYSDAAGLWLLVEDPALYEAVAPYIIRRMESELRTDPHVLAGFANAIKWYEALGPRWRRLAWSTADSGSAVAAPGALGLAGQSKRDVRRRLLMIGPVPWWSR